MDKRVISTWSGSGNITKSFQPARIIAITNDGGSDLTFKIHSHTVTVKPGEHFEDEFTPFESVVITTTVPYRALVKGV